MLVWPERSSARRSISVTSGNCAMSDSGLAEEIGTRSRNSMSLYIPWRARQYDSAEGVALPRTTVAPVSAPSWAATSRA
jgi:hypothetical protein